MDFKYKEDNDILDLILKDKAEVKAQISENEKEYILNKIGYFDVDIVGNILRYTDMKSNKGTVDINFENKETHTEFDLNVNLVYFHKDDIKEFFDFAFNKSDLYTRQFYKTNILALTKCFGINTFQDKIVERFFDEFDDPEEIKERNKLPLNLDYEINNIPKNSLVLLNVNVDSVRRTILGKKFKTSTQFQHQIEYGSINCLYKLNEEYEGFDFLDISKTKSTVFSCLGPGPKLRRGWKEDFIMLNKSKETFSDLIKNFSLDILQNTLELKSKICINSINFVKTGKGINYLESSN